MFMCALVCKRGLIVRWLRTNGVNTNGAAAKLIKFGRIGNKVRPGTFDNINAG